MVSFAINNTLCDTPSQIAPTVTSHVSATRAAYISYMLDFKSLFFLFPDPVAMHRIIKMKRCLRCAGQPTINLFDQNPLLTHHPSSNTAVYRQMRQRPKLLTKSNKERESESKKSKRRILRPLFDNHRRLFHLLGLRSGRNRLSQS